MTPRRVADHAADMTDAYRRTVHRLYAYVARRTGSRQLAEDITQEAYLRAVAHWRNGHQPDDALAWLTTVARNLLVNHYRRRRPETLNATHVNEVLATAPVDDPDATAVLYWGLARLRHRHRRLLEAFYIEGQSARALAAEFGLSERAIEGRLRRARQKLKDSLAPLMRAQGESR